MTARVESGPIQIGDDWPGVYLRGDEAHGYAAMLDRAARDGAVTLGPFVVGELRDLATLLRSCDARRLTTGVQQAVLVAAPESSE